MPLTHASNGSERNHANSVVIFGFPSSVSSTVIAHFSRFGTISENVDASSRIFSLMSPQKSRAARLPPTPIQTGKNWMKITYDNPGSASRAIHENGTLIAGQYVVGCIPVTAQNYKEFEVASETSMYSGIQTPSRSIGDFTGYDDTTADLNFTDGNVLPPMGEVDEQAEEQEETRSILNRTTGGGGPNNHTHGKAVPRTTSMPVLAGSKRVQLKDGRGIFNKQKQMRYSPSLFKIAQEPSAAAAKAATSVLKSGENAVNSDRPGSANGSSKSKRPTSSSSRGGWMSWTTKKAQELVFGWDDL